MSVKGEGRPVERSKASGNTKSRVPMLDAKPRRQSAMVDKGGA